MKRTVGRDPNAFSISSEVACFLLSEQGSVAQWLPSQSPGEGGEAVGEVSHFVLFFFGYEDFGRLWRINLASLVCQEQMGGCWRFRALLIANGEFPIASVLAQPSRN